MEVIEAIFQFQTATGRCLGVLRLPAAQPRQGVDDQHVAAGSSRATKSRWAADARTARARASSAARRGAQRRAREQQLRGSRAGGVDRGRRAQRPGALGAAAHARCGLTGGGAAAEGGRRLAQALRRAGAAQRNRPEPHAVHAVPGELAASTCPRTCWATGSRRTPRRWNATSGRAPTFVEGRYDEARGQWTARVRRADGSERVLHPRHLVFANGIVGEPKMPDTPGLSDFKGQVMHAQGFDSGAPWRGKNVLVLGVGNSAHDIAQDLHGHGANVKMIQRGSITRLQRQGRQPQPRDLLQRRPAAGGRRPDRQQQHVPGAAARLPARRPSGCWRSTRSCSPACMTRDSSWTSVRRAAATRCTCGRTTAATTSTSAART